jgi:hypothetical protein
VHLQAHQQPLVSSFVGSDHKRCQRVNEALTRLQTQGAGSASSTAACACSIWRRCSARIRLHQSADRLRIANVRTGVAHGVISSADAVAM